MLTQQVKVDSDRPRKEWEEYYGLGIVMESTPFGSAFVHSGSNGDNQCKFKIYSELNAGFIVLPIVTGGVNCITILKHF